MMERGTSIEKDQCIETGEVRRKFEDLARYEITFSGESKHCCVGITDIVDSTYITAILEHDKMCEYYSMFLNSMASIVKGFDAVVVKNTGDSILYYFPKTESCEDKNALRNVLECNLTIIEFHQLLNRMMYEHRLPPINYRVSSDYGKLTIAKSSNFEGVDIFGPTVNVCSKINAIANPNNIVIGGDLYQIVRSFKDYHFGMMITDYSLGLKLDYPVYYLSRTKK